MSSEINKSTFVTFVGRTSGQDVILTQVHFEKPGHKCIMSATADWHDIRPDLINLAEDLLKTARLSGPRRQLFLCRLSGLQFEDFAPSIQPNGDVQVVLRLTKGTLADVISDQAAKQTFPEVDDVFLPLTNLASYLRAVGDTPDASPGPQALHLTANRIEEFLLIYGGRLMDNAHSPPLPIRAWEF
ncbi:MAG: hypothetical protein ACPGRD_01290 [Planktomarina sp.]